MQCKPASAQPGNLRVGETLLVTATLVTPTMANSWLMDAKANRSITKSWVESLAQLIREGLWNPAMHQPIAFDHENCLFDGQHRLSAIIEADIPVVVPVAKCVPCDGEVDEGRSRLPGEILQIQGKVEGNKEGQLVGAVLRSMIVNSRPHTSRRKILTAGLLKAFDLYGSSAIFAVQQRGSVPSGKNPLSALVLSVVARAHLHEEDPTLLTAFCHVIRTNQPMQDAGRSKSALLLARLLVQGNVTRESLTAKCERTLQAFLAGEPLSKLYDAATNPWPMPSGVRQ